MRETLVSPTQVDQNQIPLVHPDSDMNDLAEEIVWIGESAALRYFLSEEIARSPGKEYRSIHPARRRRLVPEPVPPGESFKQVPRDHAFDDVCLSLAEEPEPSETWTIAITAGFKDAITRLDKKLLGRVLEAITDLSAQPMQLRGDTVKPLQDSRKGEWRYRIGDWRLIYRPVQPQRLIMLLAFDSRSDVYR
jgi:mRNA-degrading endonuclease RelE of RelBE toxin-antitoxin system